MAFQLQTGIKTFRKGDWVIELNQPANRFLMETLEPQAEDSYFAWNFFDAILGQKEGFDFTIFNPKRAWSNSIGVSKGLCAVENPCRKVICACLNHMVRQCS